MKIINNLSKKNHKSRIKELFENSEKIIIASPFLMVNFSDFLDSISIKKNTEIEIITTLQPGSIEQIRKVNSLLSFCKHQQIISENVKVKVSINNKLHGKIYLFEGDGRKRLIVSSANFTKNGLENNHEWGVEVSDEILIERIRLELKGSIQRSGITLIELQNLKEACDNFKEKNEIPNQKIKLNLVSLLPIEVSTEDFPDHITFWLKPIGVSEDPIPKGRKFGSPERRLHFSASKKPSIKNGDILIGYGVGAKQILAIYRAKGLPEYETEIAIKEEPWLERWAWYIEAENLTSNFGNEWWEHNVNPFDLVREFKELNPSIPITKNGGNTLGGLNRGHDKLRLRREFAEYIISKVIEINRR